MKIKRKSRFGLYLAIGGLMVTTTLTPFVVTQSSQNHGAKNGSHFSTPATKLQKINYSNVRKF